MLHATASQVAVAARLAGRGLILGVVASPTRPVLSGSSAAFVLLLRTEILRSGAHSECPATHNSCQNGWDAL
jgi:hypothetical protein